MIYRLRGISPSSHYAHIILQSFRHNEQEIVNPATEPVISESYLNLFLIFTLNPYQLPRTSRASNWISSLHPTPQQGFVFQQKIPHIMRYCPKAPLLKPLPFLVMLLLRRTTPPRSERRLTKDWTRALHVHREGLLAIHLLRKPPTTFRAGFT